MKPKATKAAGFLPTSPDEMEELGWEACDAVIVTGDAYVDHVSFGASLIGRLLEAHGYRVGIIAQPDWRSPEAFRRLGEPRLFFGITSGNMDSMVCRYTSERRLRSDDAYSPGGQGGKRPDRATIVFSQRAREAYRGVPIIIGGLEASLRRLAHYDYWSDKVRRSILLDSRADLLIYGNAERALLEVAGRLAAGESAGTIRNVRGTAFVREPLREAEAPKEGGSGHRSTGPGLPDVVRLPDHEALAARPEALAEATRLMHLETNPHCARALVQRHGDKDVLVNPPPMPLSAAELDAIHELPFARAPHPNYEGRRIPAWEMIRFSLQITRGCFGGCSFCAISLHEGRLVQSRSERSVVLELDRMREKTEGFTGVVSDLGGPTANMYRMGCKDERAQARCRRLSCLHPTICGRLDTDHGPLVKLYHGARSRPGVKKVLVASGLRHDLALRSPEYVEELAAHHVGGLLKVAPEHSEPGPLSMMMKPGIDAFERFMELFSAASRRAGKRQHLVPYFIAAHPGTTDEDMLRLALWLRRKGLRVDQVQAFLPGPATLATAMYHARRNPLEAKGGDTPLPVAAGGRQRRRHKAFLRHHDPEEWPALREALLEMGRADLIGGGRGRLVPDSPGGRSDRRRGRRRPR